MREAYIASKLDPKLHLTPKRVEMARLLSLGLSVKQIAARMNVSHSTVAEHIHLMIHSLKVKNARELVVRAIEHGFIELQLPLPDRSTPP